VAILNASSLGAAFNDPTFSTSAALRTNLQYDALKDFRHVALLAKGPLLVTVNKDSPFKTIQDLVARAKANPGKLNYGTSGSGGINHFATELFIDAANIKITHIPYKGIGPATTDLLGGQIDMLIASAPSILQQVGCGDGGGHTARVAADRSFWRAVYRRSVQA
jgi:tripartite-type tricarboxylate transporter receptor subunit TctC